MQLIAAAVVAIAVLASTGCQTTVKQLTNSLHNPRDLAIACIDEGVVQPLGECNAAAGDARLRAFVSSGSIGTIAVGLPHGNRFVDTDPTIPGFTPFLIDGLPQYVTITGADPAHLYTTLPVRQQIARVELMTGEVNAAVPLPFSPGPIVIDANQRHMYIADPAGGSLWWLPLHGFDSGAKPREILVRGLSGGEAIGGSPHNMALADFVHDDDNDGQWQRVSYLFVGHLDHGHVTVLRLSDHALIARLPIDVQCADGVDNDGDGKTDRDDSGCDDRDDPFEGDAELGALCDDGIDNDGDGLTDSVDIGCSATPVHDTCRDGFDNDGDGKTDYPDDPGCSGFGGASESRDNPACSDGIDNNNDGKTDMDDPVCKSPSAGSELPALGAAVITACSDGIDNDKDGKTDTDDDNCPTASSSGETRPVCDDGIDNDGDGLTDLADAGCYNRASASEVATALAPAAVVAASHSGRFIAIGHRRRRQLLIVETATLRFVEPILGKESPLQHASTLGARIKPAGVDLGRAPLAIAPVQFAGRDAFAVTLELRGMAVVRLHNSFGVLSIGMIEAAAKSTSSAFRPSLVIEGSAIDMGNTVPDRYASFGTFGEKVSDDKTQPRTYSGLTMSNNVSEHRTEAWRFVFRGLLPGAHRYSGRFVRSDTLVDSHADFCRLGVVPGDLLLVHRGGGAQDCGGLVGDVVRYRIAKVGSDHLVLAGAGVSDVPVTASNQKTFASSLLKTVPMPDLACVPRGGVEYEIRARHWLVSGTVTGLATSRARSDGGCAPWSASDPAQAGRLVQPELRLIDGKVVALPACPIRRNEKTNDVISHFMQRDYATDATGAVGPFANAVLSGQLAPGCKSGADLSEPPTLLPSIRDMAWTFNVNTGFRPQIANVGVLGVAIASDPKLPYVYVADQGTGSLLAVRLADLGVQATLD